MKIQNSKKEFLRSKSKKADKCNSIAKFQKLRQPRIELGAQQWECWILPLNHWRVIVKVQYTITNS